MKVQCNKDSFVSIGSAFNYDKTATGFENVIQTFSAFTGGEYLQDQIGQGLGHYYNMNGKIDKTDFYKGRLIIRTEDNTINSGISLGHYVFGDNMALNPNDTEHNLDLFAHEFGHTYQSRITGPLYLFKYGVASVYDNDGLSETDANRRGFANLEMMPTRYSYTYFTPNSYKWYEGVWGNVLWPLMWSWNIK